MRQRTVESTSKCKKKISGGKSRLGVRAEINVDHCEAWYNSALKHDVTIENRRVFPMMIRLNLSSANGCFKYEDADDATLTHEFSLDRGTERSPYRFSKGYGLQPNKRQKTMNLENFVTEVQYKEVLQMNEFRSGPRLHLEVDIIDD
ncbi:hypothetical protein [Salinigranum salinum]|uniref:hypothetical protein n=1 Tax=Salinigranum salinum TaxID=1364937 RepID=UPI001260AA23|nr:hypothetical protein [Salinigranum salinum]